MKKVILDTDIGIDDAMALLFLHYAPTVDLLAIVTGFGNASIENTTRNALYMKEYFNIAAPIFRGASRPVSEGWVEAYPDFVHGKNGLGDIEFDDPDGEPENTSGAQAIVDLAKQNQGQISIVSVGRMTNVSLALELCPELPDLVHEVVVMGGAFGFNGHTGNISPVAEANIWGDPLAADIVFTSGMQLTIVGLDVTEETIATSQFFDDLRDRAGRAGQFIHLISRCYLDFHERTRGNYECPFHDSSAVAYLLQPGSFTTQQGTVRVCTGGDNIGQTMFSDGDRGTNGRPGCRICTQVDGDSVLELYSSTLCSGSN